ncbi:MAG: hypothetical protein Q8R27_06150, partial [Phenylobacterium sp.]|nr:hypothetical protein [Phenylobacterium sp.]
MTSPSRAHLRARPLTALAVLALCLVQAPAALAAPLSLEEALARAAGAAPGRGVDQARDAAARAA